MRIVNREEFLALPSETVFSEYEPCIFTGLFIKTGNCGCDYFDLELIGNVECDRSDRLEEILLDAEENKQRFNLDFNVDGRNGCFNADQLYAVYEKQDIEQLIERLKQCLRG